MITINNIKTCGTGWRSFDRISDRQCRKHGLPRGSVVNPNDLYHVIYSPSRGGGYDNTGYRALSIS